MGHETKKKIQKLWRSRSVSFQKKVQQVIHIGDDTQRGHAHFYRRKSLMVAVMK